MKEKSTCFLFFFFFYFTKYFAGWSEIKSDFNNDIITGIPHPKTLFAFVCGSDDVDAKACKEYFDVRD